MDESDVLGDEPSCEHCGKSSGKVKLKKCGGCNAVRYCSPKCQIAHWKKKPGGHKKRCKKLRFAKGRDVEYLVDAAAGTWTAASIEEVHHDSPDGTVYYTILVAATQRTRQTVPTRLRVCRPYPLSYLKKDDPLAELKKDDLELKALKALVTRQKAEVAAQKEALAARDEAPEAMRMV